MNGSPGPRRPWRRSVLRGLLLAGLGCAVLFPVVYGLAVPEERGAAVRLPPVPRGTYRVLVADWGHHTAIVVEQPPGWALGPPGEERAAFLEYAWGDRRFYMESDFRPHAVLATLVLPTASVLYLDGRAGPPSLTGARAVYARSVDAATLHRLLVELERSFRRAADGTRLDPYAPVRGYGGRFYAARGRYLWSRDCNWWTVARLARARLAGSAAGVVFSGQVRARLRGFRPAGPDTVASRRGVAADERVTHGGRSPVRIAIGSSGIAPARVHSRTRGWPDDERSWTTEIDPASAHIPALAPPRRRGTLATRQMWPAPRTAA